MEVQKLKCLYEKDYYLWVRENLKLLEEKKYDLVDWENLLEEIEDMGRSLFIAMLRQMRKVMEGLYKWENFREHPEAYDWVEEVSRARRELEDIFEDSPSLKAIAQEFPSVWANIHTYRPFKATRRGLRASMSPGSTLSPHNLSERLTNALRAYFFGGFLSFPTWDKNKSNTPRPVVKGKKLNVCLYKTTRSDTGFKDKSTLQKAWELSVRALVDWLKLPPNKALAVSHFKGKLPTEKDFPQECPYTFQQIMEYKPWV